RSAGLGNSLHAEFGDAAGRIADGLTRMPGLNVVADKRGKEAGWGNFLDLVDQRPRLLLLCAPVRRRQQGGADVGFASDNPSGIDWRPDGELASRLTVAGLKLDAIV